MEKKSLARTASARAVFYLLVGSAAAALILGLSLPTIQLKELVFKQTTFSIFSGIKVLFREGYPFLGLIIFVFSMVFPILKLGILTLAWFMPMTFRVRQRWVHWLEVSGKWSMLDVYVVALMIIVTRTSGLIKAIPLPGIYWFAASVILAMFASTYLKHQHERTRP